MTKGFFKDKFFNSGLSPIFIYLQPKKYSCGFFPERITAPPNRYSIRNFGLFGKFFGHFLSVHLAAILSKGTGIAEKFQEGELPPCVYISPEKNIFHFVSRKKEKKISELKKTVILY